MGVGKRGTTAGETVWLGPAPADECRGVDFHEVTTDEALGTARRFQAAVRLVLGDEPPAARLRVLPAPADRPHPFELACEFDPADPAAVAYVEWCRTSAPTAWAAAGLTPSTEGEHRGRG